MGTQKSLYICTVFLEPWPKYGSEQRHRPKTRNLAPLQSSGQWGLKISLKIKFTTMYLISIHALISAYALINPHWALIKLWIQLQNLISWAVQWFNLMISMDSPCGWKFKNSVESHQLALTEASWSGSTLFSKVNMCVSMLYIPVNNFLVISGWFPVFLGWGESVQGNNTVTPLSLELTTLWSPV